MILRAGLAHLLPAVPQLLLFGLGLVLPLLMRPKRR